MIRRRKNIIVNVKMMTQDNRTKTLSCDINMLTENSWLRQKYHNSFQQQTYPVPLVGNRLKIGNRLKDHPTNREYTLDDVGMKLLYVFNWYFIYSYGCSKMERFLKNIFV